LRAGNTSPALCRIIVGNFVASDFKTSLSHIMGSCLFKKFALRTSHLYFHSFDVSAHILKTNMNVSSVSLGIWCTIYSLTVFYSLYCSLRTSFFFTCNM
jgi:hypothetical protein